MSYNNIMLRMKSNLTDGSEYNNGEFIEDGINIAHTNCDYCDKKIIAVWDKDNKMNWWPYLGHQSRRPNTYKYSNIINLIRKFHNVEGVVFRDEDGNNLLNVHARCHSNPTNWSKRVSSASIRLLCNKCFQKTYKRILIKGEDGFEYSLSILPERNETIESVMKEFNITGSILGKGGIIDYD